jgi:hypothetical protein
VERAGAAAAAPKLTAATAVPSWCWQVKQLERGAVPSSSASLLPLAGAPGTVLPLKPDLWQLNAALPSMLDKEGTYYVMLFGAD